MECLAEAQKANISQSDINACLNHQINFGLAIKLKAMMIVGMHRACCILTHPIYF